MTSLCWPASVSRFPSVSFLTERSLKQSALPNSTSWLFQQVLKRLPCGIAKKLIWVICRDSSSGGEVRPGAMCESVVCLVGCDEWVELMLICAWKASQLRSCWGSNPPRHTDTGRHLPPGCCRSVTWRGVAWGDGGHDVPVIRSRRSWRQTDPLLNLALSRRLKLGFSKGCTSAKELKM